MSKELLVFKKQLENLRKICYQQKNQVQEIRTYCFLHICEGMLKQINLWLKKLV